MHYVSIKWIKLNWRLTSPCKLSSQAQLPRQWQQGRQRCVSAHSPSAAPQFSQLQTPDCPEKQDTFTQQRNTYDHLFVTLERVYIFMSYWSNESKQSSPSEGNFSYRCSGLINRDHLHIYIEIKSKSQNLSKSISYSCNCGFNNFK